MGFVFISEWGLVFCCNGDDVVMFVDVKLKEFC